MNLGKIVLVLSKGESGISFGTIQQSNRNTALS